ncbi:gamma carbonic anhydrase family protein [bacterium]|nr:gamma carbonic anhydrase family protein [bacterium]MDB4703073.1 gamma carbonic anhydrase family protein [bacterium]
MEIDHSVNKRLEKYLGLQPVISEGVYITKSAVVFGAVTLGKQSSVWYNAVLRGDIHEIVVGEGTNIQDNAVLHIADNFGCYLGDYVTVGHSAVVHACRVGNETLVGMGATILDGAVVGSQCIVGANALVKQGQEIPDGSMAVGSPARVIRKLTDKERAGLKGWATKYVANAVYCLKHGINVGGPLPTS